MKSVWSVARCLFLAAPAFAETSVSVEEWLYLQRIGLISSVNENLWTAFEESGAVTNSRGETKRSTGGFGSGGRRAHFPRCPRKAKPFRIHRSASA